MCPNPLRPHRPHHPHSPQRFVLSALPTHSTSSPPSLTAPTAPLPLSSLGRPCKCFREVFEGFQCVPKPPPPPRKRFSLYSAEHGFGFRGLGFKLSSMRVRSGEVCTTSLGTMAEIGCDPASLSFWVPRLLPSLDSHLSAFGVGGTGGSP